MLQTIRNFIESRREKLRALSDDIWEHPEVAYTEKYASARAAEFLKSEGYEVTLPYCGIETAFRCEYGSDNGPVFAFASEYDALPEIGHGCGHNLICMAGIAAFCATAELIKSGKITGKAVLFGTPAEEGGGGKVKMQEAGCLEGIDAVVMVHPTRTNSPDSGSTANCGLEVEFQGKAAHAASSPHEAVNALDAMQLLFAAVGCFRQQMPQHARIHGVILDGGRVPNIIPDYSRCRFYLRSGVESWFPVIEQRFRDMVKGAELMTGTTATIKPFRPPYRSRKPNAVMNQEYVDCLKAFGMDVYIPTGQGPGSSDFGNFSQAVPGIHAYFAVSNSEKPAGHSTEFCKWAKSDDGFNNGLNAAAALSHIAYRYMSEPEFRTAVHADFDKAE